MSAVSSPGTPRKADKTYDGSVDFLFIFPHYFWEVFPVLIITWSTQTHYKFYLSAFSSAAAGEVRGSTRLRWPTSSDLNTRLRRIIAGYQRVVKKQELKKAAAEKVCEYKRSKRTTVLDIWWENVGVFKVSLFSLIVLNSGRWWIVYLSDLMVDCLLLYRNGKERRGLKRLSGKKNWRKLKWLKSMSVHKYYFTWI